MVDLNANDLKSAVKIIAGTCRSMGSMWGDKNKRRSGITTRPPHKISIRPTQIPLILFLIMIESSDTTEWQLTHCSPRLISLSFVPSLVPHQPHTQYGPSPILSKLCTRVLLLYEEQRPPLLCHHVLQFSLISQLARILYVFPKLPTFRMFAYERVAKPVLSPTMTSVWPFS